MNPTLKLDPERCRRRNRLTALKGRHAAPVKFLLAPPEPSTSARGTLPATEEAALERINQVLGKEGTDKALTADQVYLLYPEVGNTNYIEDRFMFLGRRTLRGIADSAAAGFAFMNSHRTGDLSTPTELPYGRTFAGRYETVRDEAGNLSARTVIGAYMLRGQQPNGSSGPTTDALFAGIEGGTIFDVSLGLYGGDPVCDVCGEDLRAYEPGEGYLCPHVPGTHRKMSEEEIDAQKARGVTDGVASYTLENAKAAEFSAVFDGAVPGAGFRKAVRLARAGELTGAAFTEANHAYRSLLLTSPRTKGRPMPKWTSLADLFGRIKAEPEHAEALGLGDLEEIDDDGPHARGFAAARLSVTEPAPPHPEVLKLREDLAAERLARQQEKEQREAERKAEAALKIKADAQAFATATVKDGKSMPFGRDDLATVYSYIHLSAAGLSTEGLDAPKALERFTAAIPPHNLTAEALGDNAAAPAGRTAQLENGSRGADAPMTEARKREILEAHPDGAAALAILNRNGASR